MKATDSPSRHSTWGVCLLLGTTLSCSALWGEVPPRSFPGQTLQVPEEQLDRGFVYHTQPGEDTQLVVRVRAELQNLVFLHSRVTGYLLVPFEIDEGELPVLGGAFRVPARTFQTSTDVGFYAPGCAELSGCQAVDLLAGPAFLDSENHPEITFEITSIENVQLVAESEDSRDYRFTLTGPLTIGGQARKVSLASELSLLAPTRRTMIVRNVGDLAVLKTSLSLKVDEFGWSVPPQLKGRLPELLEVEVFLMLNTVSPDKSMDPRDNPDIYSQYLHYLTLLRDLDDPGSARSFARTYVRGIWEDEGELQRLSRTLVAMGTVAGPELRFALKVASRANELSGSKNAGILETLARIHSQLGELESAVEWQKKVLSLAEAGSPEEEQARSLLNRYEEELARRP